jgi:hypothetical protein
MTMMALVLGQGLRRNYRSAERDRDKQRLHI